jgi:methionyl aminopeptidase
MTLSVDKKPEDGVNETEDHLVPDAEDNEEGEDEIGGEAPSTSKLIHFEPILPRSDNILGEGKKKKKKKKSKKKKLEQSDPPRIGLSKFFPDGIYPEGEIQPYKDECVSVTYLFGAILNCVF